MNNTRLAVLALLTSGFCAATTSAQQPADAVFYRDAVYFSLDKLASHLNATVSLLPQARDIRFKTKTQEWEFVNGGQRLKLPSGTLQDMKQVLLVLDGKHYVPLQECAAAFGYQVRPEKKRPNPRLVMIIGKDEHAFQPSPIGSPYHRHKVEGFEAVHEFVSVTEPLRGLRTLHRKEDVCEIAAGSTLLIRRKLKFDGEPIVVASDCGPSLDSFLIPEKELRGKTKAGAGTDTAWSRYRKWFVEEARKDASALRRGDPKHLTKSTALTIDLCWSLRRFETKLFQSLKDVAKDSKKKIHPVLFVSGRWLEQHPLEMHELVEMSRLPNIEVIWGHHSWEHPKSGGFMNDFTPPRLREDTFRLERLFLEWGIAPTVYYRFPGLIHDRVRLAEIIDLDLFPIDCDSWLALVKQKDKGPFYNRVRDGGIILIHGNGNEPAGIPAFQRWLDDHRDWDLGHLNQFFPPKK